MTQLLRLDLSKMKTVSYQNVANHPYVYDWGPPLSLKQEQVILCLIQSNQRLQFVSIGTYIDRRDQLLAILTDATLPRLKILDLFRDHLGLSWYAGASVECTKVFFENCPMSLREITIQLNVPEDPIEDDADTDDEDEIVSVPPPPPPPPPRDTSVEPCLPHPDLEAIVIHGKMCESAEDLEYILLKFIQSCSKKLKTVHTTWKTHGRIKPLMATLRDLNSIAYFLSFQPPPSSKVNTKTDKVKDEVQMRKLGGHHFVSTATSVAYMMQAVVYIYLMMTASKTSSMLAVQQLAVFESWHVVAVILGLAGCALRKWSFATLDQFFTYHLTIRSGHKLIQSGPYTYLRHPSYTASGLTGLGTLSMLYYRGLWSVSVAYINKWMYMLAHSKIPVFNALAALTPFAVHDSWNVSPTILSFDIGLWITVLLTVLSIRMLVTRVEAEEKMLKEHFGWDWDVYASKRWRFIPLVY
ncbi:hypothetical protein BG000_009458 [Podila horticola]|nr:hypothetical protein BG000_009458 [Podila horticola]